MSCLRELRQCFIRAKRTTQALALFWAAGLSTPASVHADDGPAAAGVSVEAQREESVSEVSRAAITHSGREQLEAQLHRVQVRRAHKTNLWPWVMVGTGAAYVLLGGVVNAAIALDCDAHCPAPAWSTLLVVVGAALGTAGAAWLVRTDHTIGQLESEQRQLERQSERFRSAGPERAVLASGASPAFSLHLAF